MAIMSTVKTWSPSSSASSVILKSKHSILGPPTENVTLLDPNGLKSAPAKRKGKQYNNRLILAKSFYFVSI